MRSSASAGPIASIRTRPPRLHTVPLMPSSLARRQTNGRNVLAADVNLAPLTEGDYVIELAVASGAETELRRLAIRVVR